MRSLPWVREVHAKYRDKGLVVLGVHAPEFDYETEPARLQEAIERHELTYPNFTDNEHDYWRKLRNRYWPAVYLVDKQGRIRALHVGETHAGTRQAREVEKRIEALLAE